MAFYLSHQSQYSSQLSVSAILVLIALALRLSQGMLVRKHFQAYFHIFKLGWWVFSMFIGLTSTFLTALASIMGFIPPVLAGLGTIGSSMPSPSASDPEIFELFELLSKCLFAIGSVIAGGITGLLQFAVIRKYVKSAVLWIVATALSGGSSGLIYVFFWSGLFGDESNGQNYDSIVAVTSGKIGVIYGLITGVAMMVMLQKTIEHQARSS